MYIGQYSKIRTSVREYFTDNRKTHHTTKETDKVNRATTAVARQFLCDHYPHWGVNYIILYKNLTQNYAAIIIVGMKKIILGFIIVATLVVAGCGVKSDLRRPDPSFPRDYPVY